ncbi:MAG: hypothetical protein U0172_02765 [Nitrospiraceae bacterium]
MLRRLEKDNTWSRVAAVCALACTLVLAASPAVATEIVLPGFSSLGISGTSLTLGGHRTYTWDRSYLPVTMTAAGQPFVERMELIVSGNGRESVLLPADLSIHETSPAGATLQAQGTYATARIAVTTRVEYDGLAMGRATLTSDRPLDIESLEFRITLTANANTRLMRWDIPTYRKHIRQFPLSAATFTGAFQQVVAISDGSRSFWWFTDDANRWLSNGQNTTSVETRDGHVIIRQRLAVGRVETGEPVDITFNLLTTPIRDDAPWRAPDRRIARRVTAEEGRGAGLQMWWPEAFPHQALPYAEWPSGVTQDVPSEDRRLYPGIAGTRLLLKQATDAGLTRLPYFSGHAPSLYDPVVQAHRAEWEVVPGFIIKPGADAPFTSPLERPWLSLRGPGLIEHLVGRFDQVIDQLGIEGLYFDQGAPMTSQNPAHGAWRESARRVHGTLDILAMRRYFKSLAELFHRKGKAGHLVVHMSSVPIIPAYTFVTGLVQGEEFLLDLKNTDYMGSVPLDVVRTQYAPGQYGIGSIWLDQLWSTRLPGNPAARYANQEQWLNSSEHLSAWRNYMALVLLHDVTPWSFAPIKQRHEIADALNTFDIMQSRFIGYWERPLGELSSADLVASLYRSATDNKVLIVAANTGTRTADFSLASACRAFGESCPSGLRYRIHGAGGWTPVIGDRLDARIPARDFRLIELGIAEPSATTTRNTTGPSRTVR